MFQWSDDADAELVLNHELEQFEAEFREMERIAISLPHDAQWQAAVEFVDRYAPMEAAR